MTIARRTAAPELLDAPVHDMTELAQSLDQLAEVNAWLGGRRAVIRTLDRLWDPTRTTDILDIGTGSADIPLAIARHARRRGIGVRITASDLHPQMRAIAAQRTAAEPGIRIAAADALELPYAACSFDIVLLSLTLHHFDAPEQVRVLREAGRVARHAVVVNELERCRPNWWGARLLAATRWRGNRLTRHDGPLSVLRAFTRAELAAAAAAAGFRPPAVRRLFFYRLVMVIDVRDRSSAARTVAR